MWSYNRNVLNDFVCAAREFYINSDVPPRRTDPIQDKVCTPALAREVSHISCYPFQSGSLLRAYFRQGDWSYDWILAYLVSAILCNIINLQLPFAAAHIALREHP